MDTYFEKLGGRRRRSCAPPYGGETTDLPTRASIRLSFFFLSLPRFLGLLSVVRWLWIAGYRSSWTKKEWLLPTLPSGYVCISFFCRLVRSSPFFGCSTMIHARFFSSDLDAPAFSAVCNIAERKEIRAKGPFFFRQRRQLDHPKKREGRWKC